MKVFVHNDLMDADGKINSYRFCCPIFITDSFGTLFARDEHLFGRPGQNPRIRNGTLTFVTYQKQMYGITCGHVIDALARENEQTRQEHIRQHGNSESFSPEYQKHFYFPKDDQQIHINAVFHKAIGDAFTGCGPDLAIARLTQQKMAQIGRQSIIFNSDMPTVDRLSQAGCGVATGYPEQNRRKISPNPLNTAMAVSTVIAVAPFNHVSENLLTMIYELDDIPDADNLSGMSGGPILWSDESGWGLAGIIKKGRDMAPKNDANSFLNGATIWIEGVPINEEVLRQLVAAIPDGESALPDYSRRIFRPWGNARRP